MDNRMGSIVMGFIVILVGVVLFQSLANEIASASVINTVTNESVTVSSTDNTVTNESITIASSKGDTDFTSVMNVTFFGNGTNNSAKDLHISTDINWTSKGEILVNSDRILDGNYNVSYIYTTDGTAQTAKDDLDSLIFFGNGHLNTDSSFITITRDVNWTVPGVITVKTTNFTDGDYNVSYTNLPSEYVKNATARVLLPITNIFFSIAVMAVGILMVFNGFKNVLED